MNTHSERNPCLSLPVPARPCLSGRRAAGGRQAGGRQARHSGRGKLANTKKGPLSNRVEESLPVSEGLALPARARDVGASEDQQFVLPHRPPHMKTGFFKLKCLVILLSLTTLLLTACQSKGPETPDTGGDLRPEIQALQQQLAEQKQLLEGIKSEVQGIREMIQESRLSPPEDRERTVSIDDDYFKGKASAPLTLIEFSDFQCPFCARFYRETFPLIDKEFIQTGKVKYVYRDFPIESIHKNAFKAAEAANCAGEQGRFWEMHDILFENQKALEVDNLKEYADKLNLNTDRFSLCLESRKYAGEIQKDLEDGQLAGVGGTPSFYLGFTRPDKTIQGMPIKGAKPFTYFKQIIDQKLTSKQ